MAQVNEKTCRSLVVARSGGRCERCGGIARSMHHRLKQSQGGEWSPENVVHVCGSGTTGCHGHIEANPNAAEAEGWHVRPWNNPEDISVKRLRTEWVLLLPDGGITDGQSPEISDPEGDT